jgi:hypothetical protein
MRFRPVARNCGISPPIAINFRKVAPTKARPYISRPEVKVFEVKIRADFSAESRNASPPLRLEEF